MNQLFLCPGLVFRLYDNTLVTVVYVWSNWSSECKDIQTGESRGMIANSHLRNPEYATLVGTNYKEKVNG